MSIDLSFINVAFQLTLFILFAIKAYGGIKGHIIPFLRSHQQEENEKWFILQEQHAVLISKKKSLATQFLQQEKQIALLSAKLETWYTAWKNKEKERARFFEEQAQNIANKRTTQERNIANYRAAQATGHALLIKTVENIRKRADDVQRTCVKHVVEQLDANKKGSS